MVALTRRSSSRSADTFFLPLLVLMSALPLLVDAQFRFPCSIRNRDGSYSPDAFQCSAQNIYVPPNPGKQGSRPTPVNSVCQAVESGAYFCGAVGASCASSSNCDNGVCANGVCQGYFTQSCAGANADCLGLLYCLAPDGTQTADNTCGGIGAFFRDQLLTTQAQYSATCASGYCSVAQGVCATRTTLGESCSADPGGCEDGLVCDSTYGICTAPAISSTINTTTTATTTTSSTTTTTATTTAASTTTAAPSTTAPFVVQGSVYTTKPIAEPLYVSYGASAVYANCINGAEHAYSCCKSDASTCELTRSINHQNCDTVGTLRHYACDGSDSPSIEQCCETISTAFFGSEEGTDACAV